VREERVDSYLRDFASHQTAEPWVIDPQQQSLEHERERLVDKAIAELPPEQHDVVVLADLAELPISRVAHELGVTVAAVKSRLHRARAQLRERLSRQLEEPACDHSRAKLE
jgi:RNA polymerase sigma-70 factor (ECF subfamily)